MKLLAHCLLFFVWRIAGCFVDFNSRPSFGSGVSFVRVWVSEKVAKQLEFIFFSMFSRWLACCLPPQQKWSEERKILESLLEPDKEFHFYMYIISDLVMLTVDGWWYWWIFKSFFYLIRFVLMSQYSFLNKPDDLLHPRYASTLFLKCVKLVYVPCWPGLGVSRLILAGDILFWTVPTGGIICLPFSKIMDELH